MPPYRREHKFYLSTSIWLLKILLNCNIRTELVCLLLINIPSPAQTMHEIGATPLPLQNKTAASLVPRMTRFSKSLCGNRIVHVTIPRTFNQRNCYDCFRGHKKKSRCMSLATTITMRRSCYWCVVQIRRMMKDWELFIASHCEIQVERWKCNSFFREGRRDLLRRYQKRWLSANPGSFEWGCDRGWIELASFDKSLRAVQQ